MRDQCGVSPASELAAWYRKTVSDNGNWLKAVDACVGALCEVNSLYRLKMCAWKYLCSPEAGSESGFRFGASSFYRHHWRSFIAKELDYGELEQDKLNQLLLVMSPSHQYPVVKCLPEVKLKQWRLFFAEHWKLKNDLDNAVPRHYTPPVGLMATPLAPKDLVLVEMDF